MDNEVLSPSGPLPASARAQLQTVVTLLRAANDASTVRLAAAELERLAERGELSGALAAPPPMDVRLFFVSGEHLGPRGDAEPDERAEVLVREARGRLGREITARLLEAQRQILERVEADPDWALAFALEPLDALEDLDPPLDEELLAALRRAGGGPDATLAQEASVRIVDAGTRPPD